MYIVLRVFTLSFTYSGTQLKSYAEILFPQILPISLIYTLARNYFNHDTFSVITKSWFLPPKAQNLEKKQFTSGQEYQKLA